MNGLNEFLNQTQAADDPMKALLTDFYQAYQAGDYAGASLINDKIRACFQIKEPLNFIRAAEWIETEPPEPDQILTDLFDAGDKAAIIGSSKLRKSFFLFQMIICLATGRPFLDFTIPKARRVAYVQFEIRDRHAHRRFKKICRALNVTAADFADRLLILNARGLGISGQEGVERLSQSLIDFRPEVISFDPFYKLATGAENAAEDMKKILGAFDLLAEQTGAAIPYVHHDPKGSPGDKSNQDRGAGSNVLGRDYDAAIILTPHATEPDTVVVETLLRNYRPQAPFTIRWAENEDTGGYCFENRPDIVPEKKTSKTKHQTPSLAAYLPAAAAILGDVKMEIAPFKEMFKNKTRLSNTRVKDFVDWGVCGANPYFKTIEERGKGFHKKWIMAGTRIADNE